MLRLMTFPEPISAREPNGEADVETLSQRHNSACALRCIGQILQQLEIEAFELKRYFRDFRLLAEIQIHLTRSDRVKFSRQRN